MIDRFTIKKPLFISSHTTYLEAMDERSGERGIIQTIQGDQVTLNDLAELKNDFEISGSGDLQGVLQSHKLVKYMSGVALIKDYFDGIPLDEFIAHQSPDIRTQLSVAFNLAKVISNLHQHHYVHKDIQPRNFLVHTESREVRLVNVSKTSLVAVEKIQSGHPDEISGDLHYISPEQTGRMNRSTDYRSDIYSLGVVFYQLLSQHLPYTSDNALQLVYSHIAKIPPSPAEINPKIPAVLSDIVMRMMAKNAEDRYQSVRGIMHDLEECLTRHDSGAGIGAFQIGLRDRANVFTLSEKLYGRDREREHLINVFKGAKDSAIDLVLVTGYSGVGKTRLINEIYKPLARENGNFISGKFDQYSQNSPYSAFELAVESRIRQIMTLGGDQYKWWKGRIQKAVGENGQILTDVIPDLELLIGKQEDVLKLGLSESQLRFRDVFESFIGSLASETQPLVIFIDDLQWADSGSLDVIYNLLNNRRIKHILLIGAYRDNEVSVSHPLNLMLKRLGEGLKIEFLHLEELQRKEVNQLVADSLRLSLDKTWELTDLIMAKTGGNPFFLTQFIQNLVQNQLVHFDEENGRWAWKLDEIGRMKITENVVDLVVAEVKHLKAETQRILTLASTIGNKFDLFTLATVAEQPRSVVSDAIWEAIERNLLHSVDQQSRYLSDSFWRELGIKTSEDINPSFQFQHDKIQQAAYSLIPEGDRMPLHLKVGRLLRANTPEEKMQEDLFEIVNHLNAGSKLMTERAELVDLARLNLQAGEIAKSSNSYRSSLQYLRKGMGLIESADSPELYKEILISRSECEYLSGNYEESEQMYDIALSNAPSDLERALVYAEKMKLYENTSRNGEAIKSALQGLKILGMKLPEKPNTVSILIALLKAKMMLRGKSMEDLKQRPNIETPELILAMKILINLWGPAYLNNPNLLVLAILRLVMISVKHGNAPESAIAYAFYGYITCAQLKDFKGGYEFGKLGLWLNAKFNDKVLRSKVCVIFGGCVAHWRDKFADTMDLLQRGFEVGKEANDLVYAGYSVNFLGKNHFYIGEHLDTVIEKNRTYIHFVRQIQSSVSLHHLLGVVRMVNRLSGQAEDPDIFQDSLDPEVHFSQLSSLAENEGVLLPITSQYIYQAIADFYFGEYAAALEKVEKAKKDMVAVLGLVDQAFHNFIHSASLLALALKEPGRWKKKAVKTTKSNQKIFKKWAENAPDNFKSMYLLLEAELAEIQGRMDRAARLYTEALQASTGSGMIHIIALTNEHLAAYNGRVGNEDVRDLLLRSAYVNYEQWGAMAKVRQIARDWPAVESMSLETSWGGSERRSAVGLTSSSALDLDTIFKASTIISGEVELEGLLEKLLQVVLENAGAQKGTIILVKHGKLVVVARSSHSSSQIELMDEVPIEETPDLPMSILQFGYHSSKPVILENPVTDHRFSKDPYLISHQPKSVLCHPIIQSGQMIAIFYLENNITEGAFTPERLEVLNLLSGQIAVSLQNANLYKAQQDLTRAYQRFVPLDFINALGRKSILQLQLGDSISQEMTVMFCDIRGYTTLSEGLSARESFTLINDYLQLVGPVISGNHGFINHYLGDGFIALFKNSPEDAIRASLEMFVNMKEYNDKRSASGDSPVLFGIGLHKGPVMMGIIGDEERHDANVLSDAVNIASRLEGMTKSFGANIIMSTPTMDSISDRSFFVHRQLGRYKIKGKESSLELIEIVNLDTERQQRKASTLDNYNLGLAHFTKGELDKARAYFEKVKKANPEDVVTRRYLQRISSLHEDDLSSG